MTSRLLAMTFALLTMVAMGWAQPSQPNAIDIINPTTTASYPALNSIVAGGSNRNLTARIFYNTEYLPEYDLDSINKYYTWSITPTGVGYDTRSQRVGSRTTSFKPYRAWTTYQVTVTFSRAGIALSKTVSFTVTPDVATYLVIEGSQNYDPNFAAPLNQITLTAQAPNYDHAFAILRDRYNNFVAFSNPTVWSARNTSLISVTSGLQPELGQGQVTGLAGTGEITQAIARDNSTQLVDSVSVLVSRAGYLALRIIAGRYATLSAIVGDTLRITTSDTASLVVEGQRSDNNAWQQIAARWWVSPSLTFEGSIPASSSQWSEIRPAAAGQGWIAVSYQDATPDTLGVVVTASVTSTASHLPVPPTELVMIDNRHVSVPSMAKSMHVTGFDLLGREIVRVDTDVSTKLLPELQRLPSGMSIFCLRFEDAAHRKLMGQTVTLAAPSAAGTRR
jgi:hypothetical protein